MTGSPPVPAGGFNGNDGEAADILLDSPTGVVVDAVGRRLLIADLGNDRVRAVSLTSGTVTTIVNRNVFGSPERPVGGYNGDEIPPEQALLDDPVDVTLLGADLFISDARNQRIRVVRASDGLIHTACGVGSAGFNGDGLPPENTFIFSPRGLAASPESGALLFSDFENLRVRRFVATE